jgi:hypothetical protein
VASICQVTIAPDFAPAWRVGWVGGDSSEIAVPVALLQTACAPAMPDCPILLLAAAI